MSRRARWRRIALLALSIVVLAAGALAVGTFSGRLATAGATAPVTDAPHGTRPTPTPTPRHTIRPMPTIAPAPNVIPMFNRTARSIDDPTSLWVVVDKTRPLAPVDYIPPDLVPVPVPHVWDPLLRREASDGVVAMFAAYTAETGLQLQSQSSYRSYLTQVDVYSQDISANGQAVADTSTARPGTSEHQTGLAIDISALPANCSLDVCFGGTPQGIWLAANAWRFGFLLRYPADKVPVTGYGYEPWHFRYIGVDLATEMRTRGVTTLEEYFGLPAAPAYN